MAEIIFPEAEGSLEPHLTVQQGPELYLPKRNIILDATVLSTLMACPRLTDLRFNHHFVSIHGKSVSLEMGSIVHKFLEVYYQALINGMNKSTAEGLGYVAAKEYSLSKEVTNTPEPDREYAIATCGEYLEYYKHDFWTPLEVETVKGEVLYEDEEIRILYKVKYDLISDTNQGIYPIDHKTMKQRRDTLTLNNQFIGQCIILKTRMMYVNKVGFQTSLKPEEKFTRVPLHYTADRLLEWQGTILPYYGKLMLMYADGEYWPPNFTHCENKYGFCVFKEVCEGDRNVREDIIGRDFIVGEPWDVTND